MAVHEMRHENSTVYFVVDDMGMPVSYGYLSREQAEQVEDLMESSDGLAPTPSGINVEKILADYR